MTPPIGQADTRAILDASKRVDRLAVQGLLLVVVSSVLVGTVGAGGLALASRAFEHFFPPDAPSVDGDPWGKVWFCLGMGFAVMLAILFMPSSQTRPPLRFATKDARVWRLVQRRAEHFGTFPPKQIYVTLDPTLELRDDLPAFWNIARRRLDITLALLAPEAERLLTTEVDAQLARFAGTTPLQAQLRAHWGYIVQACFRDHDVPEGLGGEIGIFVILADVAARAAVFPVALVLGRRVAAMTETYAAVVAAYLDARHGEIADGEKASARIEELGGFLASLCRPLAGLQLLPTDALRGFEAWLSPSDQRVPTPPGAPLDDLARALSVEAFDDPDRPRLGHHTWQALADGVLVDRLLARAGQHRDALPAMVIEAKGDAARELLWILDELAAGHGHVLAAAVDPHLLRLHGPIVQTRTNFALWALIESAVAAMLTSRGADLADFFHARGVSFDLHGERLSLQDRVHAAMLGAEGRVALGQLAERVIEGPVAAETAPLSAAAVCDRVLVLQVRIGPIALRSRPRSANPSAPPTRRGQPSHTRHRGDHQRSPGAADDAREVATVFALRVGGGRDITRRVRARGRFAPAGARASAALHRLCSRAAAADRRDAIQVHTARAGQARRGRLGATLRIPARALARALGDRRVRGSGGRRATVVAGERRERHGGASGEQQSAEQTITSRRGGHGPMVCRACAAGQFGRVRRRQGRGR